MWLLLLLCDQAGHLFYFCYLRGGDPDLRRRRRLLALSVLRLWCCSLQTL